MTTPPNEERLRDWQTGAQDLLSATAEAAGLPAHYDVLVEPRLLLTPLDDLLAAIDVFALERDEFLNLNAQLVALVAQVLVVERRAFWMPAPGAADRIDLAVPAADGVRLLNVASVVKAVLQSPRPSASEAVRLAELSVADGDAVQG